jgi:poly-gamma-glutamate synthesis protein (capsule biosynthesis protein)
VLTIDGQSPIRKNFDIAKYPLVVQAEPSNYDPTKMTTVMMTGITALVRATAYTMELKSVTYPGEKVRDLMREADIAHVANHVPFSTGCAFPKPDQVRLVFCSDPKYIDLLTDIGVDLIELTGHHFEDYGPKATLETLAIYTAHNIVYFGGGADKQDSIKPALFEEHGNKIAFIGCNRLDTGGLPTATDTRPGAAPCDYPYLEQQIRQLRSEGYVVIATMHWNQSYGYQPAPQQIKDFHFLADAGASLVLGSQAHYAQTMEFYNNIFIHYGQGNLFFDQMGDQSWMPKGIRREFLDRYVMYDGRLISIELITAMLEDYARPRLMTDAERSGFLQEYFNYSGWTSFAPTPTATITPTLTPMSIPFMPATMTPTP